MAQELALSITNFKSQFNLEEELYQEKTDSVYSGETKSFWQKIGEGLNDLQESYFEPKLFEKSGKLYEILGIKLFGKYCPNYGTKFSSKDSLIEGRKKEDLQSFVNSTKLLEGIHTFVLAPIHTTLTMMSLADKDYSSAIVWGITNVIINLYPIMAQRYNRNRANRLLDMLDQREVRNTHQIPNVSGPRRSIIPTSSY
ncbi:MAG: hypothetical protein ABIC91_03340 [Nanoarchaeota archaeon]|nr:hypothetical protein [Nanoarchaeota archaeon]MBU1030041.1 hypothetical protein [Nanoarchaeota archaeon]MBU1850130.1 hypothetical protein [Nanoarchaeota archaeon]